MSEDIWARCKCGLILHTRIEYKPSTSKGGLPVPNVKIIFCSKCGDVTMPEPDVTGGTHEPDTDDFY